MHSPTRPHAQRRRGGILRVVIWTLLAVVVGAFLLFLNGLRQWEEIKERSKRQKAEIAAIFTQAINDREVTDVTDGKFVVTQRHTGDGLYKVRYKNTAGQEAGYVASLDFERRMIWKFEELVPAPGAPRKVFYRERIKVP